MDPVDLCCRFDRFDRFGIDLAGAWDPAAYQDAQHADVRSWVDYNRLLNLHPDARATIAWRLAALHINVGLDAVWPRRVREAAASHE